MTEPSPSASGPDGAVPRPAPPSGDGADSRPQPSLFAGVPGERFAFWHRLPLYLRILFAVLLGLLFGLILGPRAAPLEIPSKLVLRLLGALAAPLILIAVVQALMHAQIPRGSGFRLVRLLVLNTLVAIGIGLLVANIIRPGQWTKLELPSGPNAGSGGHPAAAEANGAAAPNGAAPPPGTAEQTAVAENAPAATAATPTSQPSGGHEPDAVTQFLDNVPKSFLGPLGDEGKVISVILLAVAMGIALRRFKNERIEKVADIVAIAFDVLIVLLHWLIAVIPLAVFGIVASIVGTQGFGALFGLAAFVITVLIALALQIVYYLVRIRLRSWVRPWDVIRGTRDALMMAFSTASSTATMPVTYACLREKVGLRERSASLGALVGSNFNNDGTALYEAMAALFVSQLIGVQLTLVQQLLVVLTSVAASIGAAGIPEAGIVTMTLVFTAVKLDTRYIPALLTVDWFLDRCRTTVNVLGDVNVSCLLDGTEPESASEAAVTAAPAPAPGTS